MLFASSLFPLLLQTNDTFCAVREMKYNYFFEIMCTKCVEGQKNWHYYPQLHTASLLVVT